MNPSLPEEVSVLENNPKLKTVVVVTIYLTLMISIPVGLVLYRNSQTNNFNKLADINPKTEVQAGQDQNDKLDNINKLLTTPTPSLNSDTGPTLSLTIKVEGYPIKDQSAEMFVGIGQGSPTVKPIYLLSYTISVPSSGQFSGISLAGLDNGSTYTAYIKGPSQIDKAISFTISGGNVVLNNNLPIDLISGDLNEDNTIDDKDLSLIKGILGTKAKDPGFNPHADMNKDQIINTIDLGYVLKNKGKIGDSGVWFSVPQGSALGISIEASGSGSYIIHLPKFQPN